MLLESGLKGEKEEKAGRDSLPLESGSSTDANGSFSPSKLRIMKKIPNLQQVKPYDTIFELFMQLFFCFTVSNEGLF